VFTITPVRHLDISPFAGPGPAFENLVAYYPFDPRSPLQDVSNTLGNLIPSSTSPTYQANCPWLMSTCAVFSPVSQQYFTAPPINFGDMAARSGFTLCSWFQFATGDLSNYDRIFDFGDGVASNNVLMTNHMGSLEVHRYLPCYLYSIIYTFTTAISYGTWRHVCIANKGTNWSFYDNGVLAGTENLPCSLMNTVLSSNYLGRSNWAQNQLLQGSIAEFRIYNRVLLGSEVATLYATNGTSSKETKLLA